MIDAEQKRKGHMNRTINKLVKLAKRTRRSVAEQIKQREAPTLSTLFEERAVTKESPIRVWGPYQERDSRYRLKISESGVEKSLMFPTLEEAEAVKTELLQRHGVMVRRTLGEVCKEWLTWGIEVRGIRPATIQCYEQVAKLLPSELIFHQISERDARSLYQQQIGRVSVHTGRPIATATHHLFLRVVKSLWRWAIERGYSKTNPWTKIAPVGRSAVGKPQLRIDEARRFERVALKQAHKGDVPALGALLMMYLGLRQGEVVERVARDIDDGGRVLWVPSGKTKNARRRLKIPEHLRSLILAVAKDKDADELLFYPSQHHHRGRRYYVEHVARLCLLAKVPVVVPHSLRGLHATLALEGGATADAVARALGHSSFAITKQHYATPSSVTNHRTSRVAQALSAENTNPSDLLGSLLESMSNDELSFTLARLTQKRNSGRPSDDICPT